VSGEGGSSASTGQYRAQLKLLEEALVLDPNNEEVLRLRNDLIQVITLTEMLEKQQQEQQKTSIGNMKSKDSSDSSGSDEEFEDIDEEDDDDEEEDDRFTSELEKIIFNKSLRMLRDEELEEQEVKHQPKQSIKITNF